MSYFSELKKWFPRSWRLRPNGMIESVFFAVGRQLDDFDQGITDARNQMAIATATWSLSVREKELNLPISPNDPIELRRMRIQAKEIGYGTPTIPRLQKILNQFVGDDSGQILIRHEEALIVAQIPITVSDRTMDAVNALREAAYARDDVIPQLVTKERIEITTTVKVVAKRYHKVGEFCVGMKPLKYQNEVIL